MRERRSTKGRGECLTPATGSLVPDTAQGSELPWGSSRRERPGRRTRHSPSAQRPSEKLQQKEASATEREEASGSPRADDPGWAEPLTWLKVCSEMGDRNLSINLFQ